jgi:hypothetical protein
LVINDPLTSEDRLVPGRALRSLRCDSARGGGARTARSSPLRSSLPSRPFLPPPLPPPPLPVGSARQGGSAERRGGVGAGEGTLRGSSGLLRLDWARRDAWPRAPYVPFSPPVSGKIGAHHPAWAGPSLSLRCPPLPVRSPSWPGLHSQRLHAPGCVSSSEPRLRFGPHDLRRRRCPSRRFASNGPPTARLSELRAAGDQHPTAHRAAGLDHGRRRGWVSQEMASWAAGLPTLGGLGCRVRKADRNPHWPPVARKKVFLWDTRRPKGILGPVLGWEPR